jgi:hypothetical protein
VYINKRNSNQLMILEKWHGKDRTLGQVTPLLIVLFGGLDAFVSQGIAHPIDIGPATKGRGGKGGAGAVGGDIFLGIDFFSIASNDKIHRRGTELLVQVLGIDNILRGTKRPVSGAELTATTFHRR